MTFPAAIAATCVFGMPLVIHVHACEHRSGEHVDGYIHDLEQLGLDAATRVICVSHYTAGMPTALPVDAASCAS